MKSSFIWHDKRSLNYLLSLFIFSLGSFIINPYYAIYVSDNLGYGVAFAGVLVSIKVISQRVLLYLAAAWLIFFLPFMPPLPGLGCARCRLRFWL
ncbi:hypothetical protein [Klebsiella aerogenes]|uniref:hypothetical protein n=1 Tax=Klebsiella aerogenes TaxID=548 RepID=UPI002279A1F7|nr:hypothetical protein [Klebsiella aerogenes]MCY4766023.1 hypothetical protein [Klebsiella aerogenes]